MVTRRSAKAAKAKKGGAAKAAPPLRPGPEGGRRDQNRKEKVRGLEEAALRLFLERGLDGVTIDDITHSCGVAKGTFYRYFEDKEALVESLLGPARAELVAALEVCGKALGAARELAAMAEAYRALGGTFLSVILKHAGVVRLYLQESRGPAVGARRRISDLSGLLSRHAIAITAKAHRHGLLKPVRPEVSALAVVGAVERLLLALLCEEPIGNPLEVPDALVGIILDGLRKK
jgi:AcrR family transcriptional regulator